IHAVAFDRAAVEKRYRAAAGELQRATARNIDLQQADAVDYDALARARAGVVDLNVLNVERAARRRLDQPGIADDVAGVEHQDPGGVDRAAGIVLQRQIAVAVADRPRPVDSFPTRRSSDLIHAVAFDRAAVEKRYRAAAGELQRATA